MKDKIKIALLHDSMPSCSREVAELIGCSTANVQRYVVEDIDIQRTFNKRVLLRRARRCANTIDQVVSYANASGTTHKMACLKTGVNYSTFTKHKRILKTALEQLERYSHE